MMRLVRRTAGLVVLSLIAGLLVVTGVTGVVPPTPARAAVSVTQVGAWNFDAGTGTTAADSAGNKPATLGSGATWTPGLRGASALAVNGASGTANAATSGAVLNLQASFSVSGYIKLNNLNGYQTLASQDGNTNSGFYLQLRGDNGRFGFTRVSGDFGGANSFFASASAAPVVGQWYHLVGVYDATAGTLALYVNGRLQSTVSAPAAYNTTGNFVMGRGKFGGNPVDFVNGTIDDVRAYSGALTADDVEQIADAAYWKLDEGTGTSAADEGLNGTTGVLTGGAGWENGVKPPYALALDGVNDAFDSNKTVVDTSKSFTISTWARANVTNAVGGIVSLDGTNRSAFTLQIGADGKWAFTRPASDTAGAAVTTVASTGTPLAGTWHHLVAVYDSVAQTMTLYANGTLQTSASYTTGWKGTGNLVLGRVKTAGSASGYLSGAVDEVHVYPFAVDAAMVTALATLPVPVVPATPTATTPSSTSVTLSWTTPPEVTGASVTGYTVTPYVNGTAGTPQTFNTTATTQTFTGLTPGSSYRYTVAAINSVGTSGPSPQSTAVTPNAVPGTPAAPTATAGTQSATVTWTAPSNTGSAITGYVVTPYIGAAAQTSQTFNSAATTQTVTGLTAGTAYTFRVAAQNAAGTGTQSAASNSVTPNAAPTVSSGTPPNGRVGVAYSSQYTVSAGTSPYTWAVSAGTLPAGLTLSSAGLLSGTPTTAGSSTFTVRVTDTSGATATQAATVVISDRPGTVTTPTAAAGVTSATVSWTAPASNSSTITGYVVTPYLSGVAQTPVSFDASVTARNITGLTAGGSYTFTVAAVNAVGTGTASPQSNAVTVYDVPSAPTITAVTAGTSRVTVTWTAGSANGSAITGYVVTPYIGATAQTATTFASTATTQTVTGLTGGTAYTFRVAAQNAAGTGAQSAASASVTPNANPVVTSTTPPGGVVGTAYSYQLTNSGGTSPFTWSVTVGTLPAGLSLSSAGLISGTPTTPGSSTFTVRVSDGSSQTATSSLTIVVSSTTPSAPAKPTAAAGVTSATVSWTAPAANGSTITGYVVTPYLSGVAQTPVSFDASLTSRNITGLTAGGSYTFTVAAQNANGTGAASVQSTAVTVYDVPSAPTITAATAGDLRVTLTWTAPANNGSAITGYVVTPYIGATAQTPTTYPSTATTQTVTGLTAGTAYTFRVAAQNAAGNGPQSAPSSAVTPNANPVVTSTSPPGGVVGTAYSYQLTNSGGTAPFTWTIPTGILPSGLSFTSAGLISGTPTTAGSSTFTVQVSDGNSQTASSSLTIVVTSTTPAAPAKPTAAAGVTSATVSWTAPASNGSAITGYVVTPYLSGVAQTPVSFDASVTARNITGLTGGGSYTFTVAALNVNGTGPASVPSNAVTVTDVPAAPTITAATAGDLRVTLSWTAGAANGSAITGYVVTPYIGSTAQTPQTYNTTATTQTLTGLTAGTAYTFTVAAQNAVGTGAASAPSSAVTPNANPTVATTTLPSGVVGVGYSSQLTNSGGTAPFTWSVNSGTLPSGLTLSSAGLLSGTPSAVGSSTFTVQVSDANSQTATQSLTVVVTARPGTPAAPTATAGLTSAVVTWTAPASNGSVITGYVITPFITGTAQTPITVDPSAKTRTLNGLTAGSSYTFTVAAVNANGTGTASAASNAVTPYAALNAPTITSVTPSTTSAILSWTAPTSTGNSAITGYVVTPYIGSTAQTPQTFTGTATTRTVTGLTAGTAYTFKVAATNNSGTTVLNRLASAGTVTAVDGGPNWVDNPGYRSGVSDFFAFDSIDSVDSTVPSTTPPALFYTERYGWDAANEMAYAIPVAAGAPIRVRLFFANQFGGTTTVGSRVFDVALDGATVLPSFDVIAAAGGNRIGTMREFTTTSDGTVDLGFTHTPKSDPVIYGIEILQTGTATTGPQSAASAAATPNANPTVTSTTPPGGVVGSAYSYQLTNSGGTAPFTWSLPSGTLPTGLSLSSSGLISGTPTTVGSSTFTVQVSDAGGQTATQSLTLVVTARPGTPAAPTAAAGLTSAAVSWTAPASNGSAITGYVITPYIANVAQTPITVDPFATTRTLNGLNPGSVYTFTVAAVNANGTGSASAASNPVTPYAALSAPTVTSVTAGSTSATLSWTAPTSTGNSAITGYVVTPYIGSTAQTPQTFTGTATTRTVTGLTAGTAYTFRVAATNNSGATALYRINAGGPTVTANDGGPDWAADSDNSPLHGSGTYSSNFGAGTVTQTDGTVPASTPLSVFDDERWAQPGGQSWTLPVTSGLPVVVRLYWAENFPPVAGQRPFDVSVEGTRVLTSMEVFTATGGLSIGTMRDFSTTSDGTINIDLAKVNDNPMIDAIEVLQTGTATTGPQSAASAAATPNANPTIGFATTPNGQVAVAYSTQLTATGGTSPFSWAVTSGTLPAGLTLTTGGLLSGTPTAGGTFTYTLQVTDASGQTASRSVSTTIAAAPSIAFSPAAGEVNVAYSQQPTLTGGTAPFTWSISAGSLPAGLSINSSTGLVSGTPTASGTSSFTVRVVDANNQVATRSASIVVVPLPTLTSTPPKQYQQAGFSFSFVASGGTAPLTYAVVAGTLPSGISLSTGGVLSGQTNQGSYPFTVRVTDANGKTADDPVTLVVDAPPIQLVKTASATSVAPGGTITFTLTATNISSTYYENTHFYDPLADVLDDANYNTNATVNSGSVSYSGSTLDWAIPLNAGQSATLTYSVTVANPDTGNKILTGQVDGAFSSNSCSAGQRTSACTAAVTVSGLSVTTTANTTSTTPGSVVSYSVVVANTGQTAYASTSVTQDLSGLIDDAAFQGASATAGSVSYSSPTLTWTGPVAVGASVTISYSVKVNDPDTGNRSLTVTAVSAAAGSTCPSGNPAASCSSTVAVLIPALTITTSASSTTTTPGDPISFVMTLTNNGQTAYTGTSVNLALAGAIDDATYVGATAGAGSVDYNEPTLTWTGDLAVGATVVVTVSLLVRDPDPANKSIFVSATSAAAGSTCPVGSISTGCSTTVPVLVPELTVATSADVATTTPGSVVHYTLLVSNSGQTAYTGATASVPLTGVLDDATYNGDVAGPGTVGYASSTISWSGNLAVGATATITYSVTVRDPDPGNLSLTSTAVSSSRGSTCPAGGSDTRCTTTVTVLLPGLSITNTADAGPTVTPGTVVRYTTRVVNTGQTAYSGAVVVINIQGVVDDATYQNDRTASTGTVTTQSDDTIRWVLSLAPGQAATVTASFRVNNPVTGNKTLVTNATSTEAGSSCPTASASTSCGTSIAILVPGLTTTTTADATEVTPGDPIVFTVTILNSGETSYSNVTVTDDLSGVLADAVYTGAGPPSSGSLSYSAPLLTWTGSLAPGASASFIVTVTVRDPDPGNKQVVNRITSTAAGSNCPAGSSDTRCSATVNVNVPGLTIVAATGVASTVPGASVTSTVTVTNSGSTAFTGASFSFPLVGVLDDATLTSVTASSGTPSSTASTISWTGNLAVGASAVLTYVVQVHAADGGDNRLTTTVTSSSRGNNCPSGGSDSRCSTDVPVARLVIDQGDPGAYTTPGSVLYLVVTFTNTGQVPYTGISIYTPGPDVLDDVIAVGDQQASSGSFTLTPEAATWTGSIPVGGTVTITSHVTVKDPPTGNRSIDIRWITTAAGSNCPSGSTDPRCDRVTEVRVPKLTLTKTANTTAVVPGGSVTYTITALNNGETPYTGAAFTDELAGVLDDATFNGSTTVSTGAATYSGTALSWSGDLAVGESATLSYTVVAKSPDPGDKTMTNSVSSTDVGSTCPPASGSSACRSTVAVLTPGLTVVQTASRTTATLGAEVTYTVTVRNSGQTTQPAAAFSTDLAGVLDDASYVDGSLTANGGSPDFTDGVISWTGALAPGAQVTVTFGVVVRNPDPGNQTLSATAVSANAGSNCPSGGSDSRCTTTVAVVNSVSLTFASTADVLTTAAGKVVSYTVTATNSSEVTESDVQLTQSLTGILDDSAYGEDVAADSGSAAVVSDQLSWTGSLTAGATATITFSVTVDAVPTGDSVLTGTVVSGSLPGSNNCTVGSSDPRCTTSVPVAALLISQAYTETTTTPGSLIHLTATFTNTGQAPYEGITIAASSADTVDDAVPTGDQTATSGQLVLSPTAITWTGDIPVGGSVTVTGTLTVKALNPDGSLPGDGDITGTLVTTADGSNCASDSEDARCTALSTVLVPELTLTTSSSAPVAVPGTPGARVTYTVLISNTGETPYTNVSVTDSLAGALDDATFDPDDVEVSSGAVTYAAPNLTWTGNVAVGQTITVTIPLTAQGGNGDNAMVTVISSSAVGSSCLPANGDPACRAVVVVLHPALTFSTATSVASADPGDVVTTTITVQNTGQTPYNGATFSIDLSQVLDDATYTGGATSTPVGTVDVSEGVLSWTGSLNPGASATVSYAVTVNEPDTGNFRLDQKVLSTELGSTCANASADPRCSTSVPIASLHMSDVASADGGPVTTAAPTDVVRFTETYENVGQVPLYGVRITIDGTDTFDDATYNEDATPSSGSLTLDPDTGLLTWTGDIAVGQTVTTTGSVTVNNPPVGVDPHLRTRISTDDVPSNCPPDSTDPECLVDVEVLIPGLSIVTTPGASATTPGSTVGYTTTVTNTGETAYTGATVTDDLSGVLDDTAVPTAVEARAGDGTSTGQVAVDGPTLTWTGNIPIGGVVTIRYNVQVDNPDTADLNLVNRVTSDELGSTCPTGGTGSACSSLVTVQIPALDVSVTADTATTYPGAVVTYTLSVTNSGQTDYLGASATVALAGVLDDATFGSAGTPSRGSVSYTAPNLVWSGDLAVGESAVTTYTVTVNDPDNGNKSLLTAVSSAAEGSSCPVGAPCTSTVVVQIPALVVSTSASTSSATPGLQVTFTITLHNTGERAYVGTVTTASLAGVLDDAGLRGGFQASSGTASYSGQTQTLTWTGTLPVGDTATVTYVVQVNNPDNGDHFLDTTVRNQSSGSTCRNDTTSPLCAARVTVLVPALAVTVTASAPFTTPGSSPFFTVLITNTGETPYTDAVVRTSLAAVLDDAEYAEDAEITAGGGNLGYAGGVLSWTGDLAVGASAVSIRIPVTVDDPDAGDKALVASTSSTEAGSRCPTAAAAGCSATVQVRVPALAVAITADSASVVAGEGLGYTVTLENTGETDYTAATFTVDLAGAVDDAAFDSSALVAETGSADYAESALTWTGDLASGASTSVSFRMTTNLPVTGDKSLDATLVAPEVGSNCPSDSIDQQCSVQTSVLVPELTITKGADASHVVAGERLTYTIMATNTGESDFVGTRGAGLTDDLTGVLEHADYDADSASASTGDLSEDAGVLSWSGSLLVGESVQISYSVTVASDPVESAFVLTNQVVSSTPGNTCPGNGTDPRCSTSTTVDADTLTLSGLTPSFTLAGLRGDTVTLDDAVVGTVTTNSNSGYSVTVQAAEAALVGSSGNPDTIPVSELRIRPNGTSTWVPLSATTPLRVGGSDTASAPGGDAFSNDAQIQIPDVNSDTYSGELEYIVATQ